MAISILMVLLCNGAVAANVLWNCLGITYGDGQSVVSVGTYELTNLLIWPEVGFAYSINGNTITMTASADHTVPESIGNWVEARGGDVVCEATTRHLDDARYFYHAFIDQQYDGSGWTSDGKPMTYGSPITKSKGEDFYLMFAVKSIFDGTSPDTFYGWVQILVGTDGAISVGTSAIDLDGGPMIVGGGSATPEPASGQLLLVGGALLALRRRAAGAAAAKGFDES